MMDYATVRSIREKLQGDEWLLLEAAWKARHNLLEVLEARPMGLSQNARSRYEWFVHFAESLLADLVWYFRACEGYGRLTDEERETIEAEVFELPPREFWVADDEMDLADDAEEHTQFSGEAARVVPALTPDQRHYLFRAWQLTKRITEAVNTPRDQLDDEGKAGHERRVRELSHHHVQMRLVLESLAAALRLPMLHRRCIETLLRVRFDDA